MTTSTARQDALETFDALPLRVGWCPACGAQPARFRAPLADLPWLSECGGCGIRFADPQPRDEELDRIYDGAYFEAFGDLGAGQEAYRGMLRVRANDLLAIAERRMKPGRLLDVGCGVGELLSVATGRGWTAAGVERNGRATQSTERRTGAKVWGCVFEDAPLEEESFELITLTDVLEHLRDPTAVLKRVHSLLSPGGMLLVTTIDVRSAAAAGLGAAWWHYHRDHLWYFHRRALCRLAGASGFAQVRCTRMRKPLALDYVAAILARNENVGWQAATARLIRRVLPRWMRRVAWRLPEGLLLIAMKSRVVEGETAV